MLFRSVSVWNHEINYLIKFPVYYHKHGLAAPGMLQAVGCFESQSSVVPKNRWFPCGLEACSRSNLIREGNRLSFSPTLGILIKHVEPLLRVFGHQTSVPNQFNCASHKLQ